MSLGPLVLGIINAVIVIAVLLLVGVVVQWGAGKLGIALDPRMETLYILIVGLIGLYMIIALIFGLPSVRVL